jgi:hypothetical protein
MRPETPGQGSWWSRIGTLGQVLTALIGLIAALVPILATTGLPSQGGGTQLPPAAVTRAGNYSYVASAVIRYYDDAGDAQIATASGRGSVAIDDGTRLDVYLVEEADGISLTLQSAS